jgi:hypothetical protein
VTGTTGFGAELGEKTWCRSETARPPDASLGPILAIRQREVIDATPPAFLRVLALEPECLEREVHRHRDLHVVLPLPLPRIKRLAWHFCPPKIVEFCVRAHGLIRRLLSKQSACMHDKHGTIDGGRRKERAADSCESQSGYLDTKKLSAR